METNPKDPSRPSITNTSNALPPELEPAVATEAPAMFPIADPLHRRARSEFFLRISEDFDLSCGDPMATTSLEEIGSEDDFFSTFMDIEKIGSGSEDGAGNAGDGGAAPSSSRGKHRYSNSADGSSASSVVVAKGETVFGEILETKKAMTAEQLMELTATDPKRAKRIMANRQSAARSKERKARYISDLERRVQTLQTEATTLSAQLTLYQRDTTCLSAENAELKLRLQTMEQQAQLRDALNEALKNEVERLKIATGEAPAIGDPNKAAPPLNSLAFNHSSLFPTAPPRTSFPQQPIQAPPPFRPHQFAATNFSPLSYSHPLSEVIPHEHLGRLQRLDISKSPLKVKSESSSISAAESSSNFGSRLVS